MKAESISINVRSRMLVLICLMESLVIPLAAQILMARIPSIKSDLS